MLLCFSLFLETLLVGVNEIVWSDSAEVKAIWYCDFCTSIGPLRSNAHHLLSTIYINRFTLRSLDERRQTDMYFHYHAPALPDLRATHDRSC